MKQKSLKEVQELTKGQELVIKSNEDYTKAEAITTSDRIDLFIGYEKEFVDRLIKNHLEDFKLLDKTPPVFKTEGQKGTKSYKTYFILTEQQAYFLMTLMKNNEVVIKFKANLVKAFFAMKHTIEKSQQTKPIAIAYNKSFHDMINIFNGGEENDFTHWSYKLYNDEVYKIIIGETARQRRLRLELKRDANIDNTLTAEEHMQKCQLEEDIKKIAIKNNWHKLPSNECYHKVKDYLKENYSYKPINKELQK